MVRLPTWLGRTPTMKAMLAPTEADLWRAAAQSSPFATIVADEAGAIVLANPAAELLLGYEGGTLLGVGIETLVPERLRDRHAAHRLAFSAETVGRPMGRNRDLEVRRRDGQVVPVEIGLTPVRAAGRQYVVCALLDLTERKRTERRIAEQAAQLQEANARLEELATTDSLTALRNRRAFLDQLNIQLELAARAARPLSILFLDLDHFKEYNDRYGHLAGDEVLRKAAQVLRDRARRSDIVARVGGEEFGILLPEADRSGALTLGERFRAAIEASAWPRRPITMSVGATTVSFRAAVPRPMVPTYSQVLSAADRALYRSKAAGRNRVSHVDESDGDAAAARRVPQDSN
jgi:diguanylate cyclase (GGDEF)-like protein/PAS domain S-box-containing protein